MEGWGGGAEAGGFGVDDTLLFYGCLISIDRINKMRQILPHRFLPNCHAIFLGDAPGLQVLGADQRNDALDRQSSEAEITAGTRGLWGKSLSPEIATQVVADLNFINAIDLLHREAAVAYEFAVRFQNHRPQAVTVFLIASQVAGNPIFDCASIKRSGIEAHGFDVGKRQGQGVYVVAVELAQNQPRCFKDLHVVLGSVCSDFMQTNP